MAGFHVQFRRTTRVNCGEDWIVLWHREHLCYFKTRGYCRKRECPIEACRLAKAMTYVNHLLDVDNPNSYWIMEHAEKHWRYMTQYAQPEGHHRISFTHSRQIFVISKNNLFKTVGRMRQMPQTEALLLFREVLIRPTVKRVTPAVKPSTLIVPLVIDKEEVLDEAMAHTEYKYGQRIEGFNEVTAKALLDRFIPNKSSDQGIQVGV